MLPRVVTLGLFLPRPKSDLPCARASVSVRKQTGLRWLQGSFRQTSASFMFGLPRHFHPFHDLDLIKWLTFKYFSTNLSSTLESVVRGFQYFQ